MRCNEFLTTDKHKSVHNFLKHYDEGKDIPFEDKPIEILRFPGLKFIRLSLRSIRIPMIFLILKKL